MPSRGHNEEEKQVGLERRALVDLWLDEWMHGGIVGREKVFDEELKLLEELLREPQRDLCLATEDEQVGETRTTSKYRITSEVCVCMNVPRL